MGRIDRLTSGDSATVSMAGPMAGGPAIATRSLGKTYATSAGANDWAVTIHTEARLTTAVKVLQIRT